MQIIIWCVSGNNCDIFRYTGTRSKNTLQTILHKLRDHWKDAGNITADIFKEVSDTAKDFNVNIAVTRVAGWQRHRSNSSVENIYICGRSLTILYLDSTMSREVKFSANGSRTFSLKNGLKLLHLVQLYTT